MVKSLFKPKFHLFSLKIAIKRKIPKNSKVSDKVMKFAKLESLNISMMSLKEITGSMVILNLPF